MKDIINYIVREPSYQIIICIMVAILAIASVPITLTFMDNKQERFMARMGYTKSYYQGSQNYEWVQSVGCDPYVACISD